MSTFTIRVEGGPRPFECGEDDTVLQAMRTADLQDIAFKCRAGGCGTCRVQVLAGTYATGAMSPEQIEEGDLDRHIVLACQLYPRTDLFVRPYRRSIDGVLDAGAPGPGRSAVCVGSHVPREDGPADGRRRRR